MLVRLITTPLQADKSYPPVPSHAPVLLESEPRCNLLAREPT